MIMRYTQALVVTIFLHQTASHSATMSQPNALSSLCSLNTTSTWHEYTITPPNRSLQQEKWAWAKSFILKSKHPLVLSNLTLQWHGKQLHDLAASLYRKRESAEAVIPIQENLVCEGMWNSKNQQLIFPLAEKVIAVNKYYLVLSYSSTAEPSIKKGSFSIKDVITNPIKKNLS